MKPRVEYKLHLRAQEINEEKEKRKRLLQQTADREQEELRQLKQEKALYHQSSKDSILSKKHEIHAQKPESANRVKEEELHRQERIQEKKLALLSSYIPDRIHLVEALRQQYLSSLHSQSEKKKELREQEDRRREEALLALLSPVQVEFEFRNVNEGVCVICLSEKAEFMMAECRHLIACKGCEFVLRMNKKCPLCRAVSGYKSIFSQKKDLRGAIKIGVSGAKKGGTTK